MPETDKRLIKIKIVGKLEVEICDLKFEVKKRWNHFKQCYAFGINQLKNKRMPADPNCE